MSSALEAEFELRQGRFFLKAQFSVPTQGITVLFGPSGSGKTTILEILAGLRPIDKGRISLGDRVFSDSISASFIPAFRRDVGLVFQDARLFPHLTAGENIRYSWVRAPSARRLGITEVARFFDISSLLDRPVGNLSGGEKSRVALARALVSRPKFLLLDEPFAALDGVRRRNFIQVLLAMNRAYELPMMVVTHNIDDTAALSTHLVGLSNGSVIACDRFEEASHTKSFRALLDPADLGAGIPATLLHTSHDQAIRRVWLRADQVLLASEPPRAISARNVIEGRIEEISSDDDRAVLVEITSKLGPLLARVTVDAAHELKLRQSQPIWALVKARQL